MAGATFPDDLFSILEILEGAPDSDSLSSLNETTVLVSPKVGGGTISSSTAPQKSQTEAEAEASHDHKKQKLSEPSTEEAVTNNPDGQQRVSHITVEKNRGKQMNEQLSFLRSVVPCIYVKRGDQASIIGGVVDYIKELQQVLQSLEAKKQRKVYGEVLNPRPSQLNPRRPPPPLPLSPRLSLPISPRTPQPGSPYLPKMQQSYLSPITMASTLHEASLSSSPSSFDNVKELSATSKSAIAEVEVKISGPNVLLKTKSPRIPGQVVKIVAALESLALEVLHVSINTVDDTMLHSFIIKIGIECELSAEELANEIQQTFC